MEREVPCPTCGKPVSWGPASRWRPFCSERCRLVDLGAWLDESHGIPGEDASDAERPAEDAGAGR
jgi:hypothetical protein